MRCRFMLLTLAVALGAVAAPAARAQSKFPCEAFVRLGDGSWQAVTPALIPGPNFKVTEGSLWRPGAIVMGVDVATTLDKECPNAPVYNPQAPTPAVAPGAVAPGPPQQPQVPQTPLARYADANGNIDIRTLTCGHLDDAAPEEANALLTWYSGWYNASGKGHGINLPRLRYAVRSVVDYCKANRDKSLVKVMELMLK
jgi:HdeA/HdeB family